MLQLPNVHRFVWIRNVHCKSSMLANSINSHRILSTQKLTYSTHSYTQTMPSPQNVKHVSFCLNSRKPREFNVAMTFAHFPLQRPSVPWLEKSSIEMSPIFRTETNTVEKSIEECGKKAFTHSLTHSPPISSGYAHTVLFVPQYCDWKIRLREKCKQQNYMYASFS